MNHIVPTSILPIFYTMFWVQSTVPVIKLSTIFFFLIKCTNDIARSGSRNSSTQMFIYNTNSQSTYRNKLKIAYIQPLENDPLSKALMKLLKDSLEQQLYKLIWTSLANRIVLFIR